ncbi:sodium/proline symporter PutP [Opacimonas viscosa]|uniref:Sodium/proline symporter n=1 Tax=Opacimonas viscosa TaxID=2961944 RepID=A0AA42BMH7_9ALTE|nr:sodium/proline symporter PutP [Opacimonas viscosa]MCP3428647.1 sodium/proline symporter PutP [Opacimonas viscosa]
MLSSVYISLGLYFIVMLGIGLFAYRNTEEDVEGYLLGGRKLSPAVVALSAGASDMSGWMLMGLPGAMYVSGLSASWIAIGLVIGAWCNYLYVAPRLRVYTEVANNAITIPDFFAERFNDTSHILRIVSAIVIIVFFTLYTSSGLVAGGKLFESSFGLNYELGLYITAGVVVTYTLFGGFMAVSLTDFVQGCLMFIALILVPTVVMFELGGITATMQSISAIDPAYFSLFNAVGSSESLTVLGIISLMAWGLGYFGQPHIIVRFMAIRSVKDMPIARKVGMSWMILALVGALSTGLFGMAYVAANPMTLADPETIFVVLSQVLFHPLIAGFLLAAILAAIMSTISSQLLVTSSSLVSDIYEALLNQDATDKQLVLISRLAVLGVAILAIILAMGENQSILGLVSNAWAGFGAAFGPVILCGLYWSKMTRLGAIAGMLSGTVVTLVWLYVPFAGEVLNASLYAIVPGFIANIGAIYLVSQLDQTNDPQMQNTFNTVVKKLKEEA